MSRETTGTATQLVNFGQAIEALKQGKAVKREFWEELEEHGYAFVFRQVPSVVDADIIPKMTSLPEEIKEKFAGRNLPIKYKNQLVCVSWGNTIQSWTPTSQDILAEDWIILK